MKTLTQINSDVFRGRLAEIESLLTNLGFEFHRLEDWSICYKRLPVDEESKVKEVLKIYWNKKTTNLKLTTQNFKIDGKSVIVIKSMTELKACLDQIEEREKVVWYLDEYLRDLLERFSPELTPSQQNSASDFIEVIETYFSDQQIKIL